VRWRDHLETQQLLPDAEDVARFQGFFGGRPSGTRRSGSEDREWSHLSVQPTARHGAATDTRPRRTGAPGHGRSGCRRHGSGASPPRNRRDESG
jgi:hypothetical protein